MCFSPQASFISAAVISTIGVISLIKAHNSKISYFASSPIFFGIQQTLEGIVWITLNSGNINSIFHKIGVYGFLCFAGIFWPIWIPIAIYLIEKNKTRKKLLSISILCGIIFAALVLFVFIFNGMHAQVDKHHIVYLYNSTNLSQFTAPYMPILEIMTRIIYCIATIGALFISTIPEMCILGVTGIISLIIAQVFYSYAHASAWCFFAAVSSVLSYWVVVKYQKKYSKNR